MTLNNIGTAPLLYSISSDSRAATDAIGAESFTWGTVLPPFTDVIQPGGYAHIEFATDLGALPPGDATHAVRINTNAPYTTAALSSASYVASSSATSAVTGITLTVPWSVSVLQAFVFPNTLAYTVAPTVTAPVQLVSVVNFAGAPIFVTARLPAAASSWLYLDTADAWLPDSGVLSMGVSTSYPILNGSVAVPGAYIRNAIISLWRAVDVVSHDA